MGTPTGQGSKRGARNVLYQEHLLLGAQFGEGRTVSHYASQTSGQEVAQTQGVSLAELTHLPLLLFSGASSESYASAAFAGRQVGVGSCAFEAVLSGDGSIASVPLLARTGVGEYLVIDFSPRSEVLEGWLSFLAGIEQDGSAAFPGLTTEDVSATHVIMGLWGPDAFAVLGDYTEDEALPAPGEVAAVNLDRMPCIVLRLPGPAEGLYLLLVPPVHAVALWRSLLSFRQVQPRGVDEFCEDWDAWVPWAKVLASEGTLRLGRRALGGYGIVRDLDTYVGARALDD